MSRRDTTDRLVKQCLELYGVNFLQVPRTNVDVGACWLETRSGILPPGQLASLLGDGFVLPMVFREDFAPARNTFSRALDLKTGLSLTDRLLSGIGVIGFSVKAKAGLEAKRARNIRLRIDGATRDALDVFQLDESLEKVRVREVHRQALAKGTLYCAVGVVRARGITLRATDQDGTRVTFSGDVSSIAGVELDAKQLDTGDLALEYAKDTPIAFGVELVELESKPEDRLSVKGVADAREIRTKTGLGNRQPLRCFIGDEKKGDIFVDF